MESGAVRPAVTSVPAADGDSDAGDGGGDCHDRRVDGETAIEFPIGQDMPSEERDVLQALVLQLKPAGVPDTVAYITEEELMRASKDLEEVGYDPQSFLIALTAPPSPVDYFHLLLRPR